MNIDFDAIISAHDSAIHSVKSARHEIASVAADIKQVIDNGGSIYICGNGGSAADAQHFAAELTGRYQKDRKGYPALALTTDSSALTAISNDYGFDQVFSRQLQALAKPNDMLIGISTSGNSSNVIKAVEYGHNCGMKTVGLLGRDGGAIKLLVDRAIVVDVESTARIQEAHILILHILCEYFEPA